MFPVVCGGSGTHALVKFRMIGELTVMDRPTTATQAEGEQYGQPTTALANKHLLTRREAAAFLNVSEKTIQRYERSNMLRSIHLTRRNVRYRRADLESMLTRFEVGGAE